MESSTLRTPSTLYNLIENCESQLLTFDPRNISQAKTALVSYLERIDKIDPKDPGLAKFIVADCLNHVEPDIWDSGSDDMWDNISQLFSKEERNLFLSKIKDGVINVNAADFHYNGGELSIVRISDYLQSIENVLEKENVRIVYVYESATDTALDYVSSNFIRRFKDYSSCFTISKDGKELDRKGLDELADEKLALERSSANRHFRQARANYGKTVARTPKNTPVDEEEVMVPSHDAIARMTKMAELMLQSLNVESTALKESAFTTGTRSARVSADHKFDTIRRNQTVSLTDARIKHPPLGSLPTPVVKPEMRSKGVLLPYSSFTNKSSKSRYEGASVEATASGSDSASSDFDIAKEAKKTLRPRSAIASSPIVTPFSRSHLSILKP